MKDEAKKMAQLLRSGNTMLNQACPVCNNPIFRNKEGKIFCPICNREVLFVDQDIENKIQDKENPSTNLYEKDHLNSLKQVILDKIDILTQKLKSEDQIDNIERIVLILIKLFDLLKDI